MEESAQLCVLAGEVEKMALALCEIAQARKEKDAQEGLQTAVAQGEALMEELRNGGDEELADLVSSIMTGVQRVSHGARPDVSVVLTSAVKVGDSKLDVSCFEGFEIGDRVQVGNGDQSEQVTITMI